MFERFDKISSHNSSLCVVGIYRTKFNLVTWNQSKPEPPDGPLVRVRVKLVAHTVQSSIVSITVTTETWAKDFVERQFWVQFILEGTVQMVKNTWLYVIKNTKSNKKAAF